MTRSRLSRPALAILLLATVVRLINLEGRTTEYDEIVSVLFAAADLPAMVRGTAADTMPPLYYVLLHLWAPNIAALWWERLPSVAFSVATVAVAYLLGLRTVGRTGATLGALFVALSPFFVFFAQFARMYALLTLLVLLAALSLLETTRRPVAWAAYAAAALGALYAHNLAVVNLAALHLAALPLLAHQPDRRRWLLKLALADTVVAFGFLPWLTFLPEQLAKINRAFWIERPGAAELVRTPIAFLFNLPAPPWALPLLLFWTILLTAVILRAGILHRKLRRLTAVGGDGRPDAALSSDGTMFPGGLAFVALLAAAPVALMFAVSQVRPIYVERGVMAAAAAGFLLLGWAIAATRRRGERLVLTAGTIVLMTGSLVYYYQYDQFPRSRYREAAARLAALAAPGDTVLHETKLSYFPMRYFQPGLPQHFLADPPGSPNDTLAPATMAAFGIAPATASELDGAPRVWLVTYRRSFEEAGRAGRQPAAVELLTARRDSLAAESVGDLVLIPFGPVRP
ncbi:MAG: glycosyltransferase family 39 protein [Chloroflexi bacterium]|nr:glycosyltransferase family 39 protein [Chloroflexota bacterium]